MKLWGKYRGIRLGGSLKSLWSDSVGATLPIGAAAILLLIVLVGSGIDISRGYMAQTTLQSACDAGVLAGRKAMGQTDEYGDDEQAKADRMFAFNYVPGQYDAANTSFVTQSTEDGEVTGTATSDVPTVIMHLFGFNQLPLSVACSAELQLASADVMFVLDTTGSMNCVPGAAASAYCPTEATDSKIDGLRDAIFDFYGTVAGAVQNDATRIRFGFVPYSMSVNIRPLVNPALDTNPDNDGDTPIVPADFLTDTTSYQSRQAQFNGTPVTVTNHNPNTPTSSTTTQTYGSNITQAQCGNGAGTSNGGNNYGRNRYPSSSGAGTGTPVAGGGPAPTATTSTAYSFQSWTRVSGSGASALGTCRRNRTITTTTYTTTTVTTHFRFSGYRYINVDLDTSGFKSFGTMQLASGLSTNSLIPAAGHSRTAWYNLQEVAAMTGTSNITRTNYTWGGCIEERDTVEDLDMDPVPDDAFDLDIIAEPNSNETRWKPFFAQANYLRGDNPVSVTTGTSPPSGYTQQPILEFFHGCPADLRLFEEVDTADPDTVPAWLTTYVNGLVARGYTYHDIGMIWGGRLASPEGINQDNVTEDDLTSVSRHIIFMTDGQMQPMTEYYSAYGLEKYNNRIAPAGTDDADLIEYHDNRFLAACGAAKAEGYTIWVVAFSTALTQNMRDCSSGNRAYLANDTAQLTAAFRFIASQVADLRLNQ